MQSGGEAVALADILGCLQVHCAAQYLGDQLTDVSLAAGMADLFGVCAEDWAISKLVCQVQAYKHKNTSAKLVGVCGELWTTRKVPGNKGLEHFPLCGSCASCFDRRVTELLQQVLLEQV